MPCVPATRSRNPHGNGTSFHSYEFSPSGLPGVMPSVRNLSQSAQLFLTQHANIAAPPFVGDPPCLILRYPNDSSTTVHRLAVCHKSNHSGAEKCNLLLVEPAMTPRSDREPLLSAADYYVTAVFDVRQLFELRLEKPVAFAVLNDLLGAFGLRAAAQSVRRQWPLARILVIGSAAPTLEDHLYDETISHQHEKDGLLDALRLLKKDSWSQLMAGGYAGYRRAAAIHDDSDPTKAVGSPKALGGGKNDVPLAAQRMRATG